MDEADIQKNIYDLEYQYLLNIQNIVLGIIGAAIVTVSFITQIPDNWPSRGNMIFLLVLLGLLFIFYFNDESKKKINEIRRIKSKAQS